MLHYARKVMPREHSFKELAFRGTGKLDVVGKWRAMRPIHLE